MLAKYQKIPKSIIGFTASLVLTSQVFAVTPNLYAQGLQAEMSGDTSLAIEKYLLSAKGGLSDAKYALGRLYRDTNGNESEAYKWFMDAAKQGNAFAQYEIGMIYRSGNSVVTEDDQEAQKWFILAADQGGSSEAAFELFSISKTNHDKQSWLLKAAAGGVNEAIKILIEAYRKGDYGFSVDNKKVIYWQTELAESEEHIEGDIK